MKWVLKTRIKNFSHDNIQNLKNRFITKNKIQQTTAQKKNLEKIFKLNFQEIENESTSV